MAQQRYFYEQIKMTEQNLQATAYHEAGHTVVDTLLGDVPISVDIRPKDDKLGHVKPMSGWEDTESARVFILSCCAGYAAEIELGQGGTIARTGAESDFEQAQPVIEMLDEGDESYWIDKAQEFVRQHWTAVEAVANELLEHYRLIGDEIDLIVAHAEGDLDADVNRFRNMIGRFDDAE